MNFLSLCQRLRQECGVDGTGPVSVTGQTGEQKRLVDWIVQAWVEIQEERPDWLFLRKDFSFDTVASQQSYDVETDILLTDFASWKNNSFRLYSAIADETFLRQYPYNLFRDTYLRSTLLTTYSRPANITIAPDKALVLAFPPNAVYTVKGEYYSVPIELSLNEDIPAMPERFHMMIVYAAMMYYGVFEAANEVYARGEKYYNKFYSKLSTDQAPPITGIGGFS